MHVVTEGLFFDADAAPASERSVSSTSVVRTADGTILVGCRLGSDREGPDGHAAIFATRDEGRTWETRYRGVADREWDGVRGEARSWLLAEPEPGLLVASVLWVDRSDPAAPWVNQVTQGLLPMRIYHVSSTDGGRTWGDRRRFDTRPYPAASPTGPVLRLPGGALAQPFEHWKEYDDPGPGRPAALLRVSRDDRRTWPAESVVARDPDGRVYFWDQRLAVDPASGTLIAMFWTHEPEAGVDRDVHAAFGSPDGLSWTDPAPTGLPGQHTAPIPLDGGTLLAVYAQRRRPPGIRAVASADFGRTWDRGGGIEVHASQAGDEPGAGGPRSQGEYWNDMGAWQFGHPAGVALPGRRAFVAFSAGRGTSRSGHWAIVQA